MIEKKKLMRSVVGSVIRIRGSGSVSNLNGSETLNPRQTLFEKDLDKMKMFIFRKKPFFVFFIHSFIKQRDLDPCLIGRIHIPTCVRNDHMIGYKNIPELYYNYIRTLGCTENL